MKTFRVLLFFVPLCLPAQLLRFGVQGGFPTWTPLGQASGGMPFAVGPTVEVRAWSGVSFESGALYYRMGDRRTNYTILYPENSVTMGSERVRGNAVEIPLLAKYRFLNRRGQWQPFVSAGAAIRRTDLQYNRFSAVLSGTNLQNAGPEFNGNAVEWNVDPVIGAGVTFRVGRLQFEPQARYSYWNAGKNAVLEKNQVHVIFGLRF